MGTESNKPAKTQANISKELYQESSPLRQALFSMYGDTFNSGGFSPSGSYVYNTGADTINAQFDNAEKNIIANTAEGGALSDLLARNEYEKASAKGNLAAGVAESDLNRAIQLATGQTAISQSGFGSAAQAQAQQAAAEGSTKAGLGQAGGNVLGSYIGSKS